MEKNVKVRNEMTLDSREVAKMLKKKHKNLLRDITRYSNYFNGRKVEVVKFFQKSQYIDSKGEKRNNYRITRKGCEFLAHKLTGRKGSIFTALYINRFHEMEKEINNNKNYGSVVLIPADKIKFWDMLKRMDDSIADNVADLMIEYEKLEGILKNIGEIKQSLGGIGGTHRFILKKFEGE